MSPPPSPSPSSSNTTAFLDAMKARRSLYSLSCESPIPDARIEEIVQHAVLHVPSPFNSQSARCVVLLKGEHQKLWDVAGEVVETTVPEELFRSLYAPRIKGFREGYGTVLFFEDPAPLKGLEAKWPMIADKFPQWSEHSNGMLQYAIWTSLSLSGHGCNLQHYNPMITARVQAEWDIPLEWSLKAQLVFGTPTAGPKVEKTFQAVGERVKVYGK